MGYTLDMGDLWRKLVFNKVCLIETKNYINGFYENSNMVLKKSGVIKLESIGWLVIAESSLKRIWENEKDEETWEDYLD